MSESPAAASNVGSMSRLQPMPFSTEPVLIFPAHLADFLVVGDHAIALVVLPTLASVLCSEMGPEVHRG
jgi:hypothetical protein